MTELKPCPHCGKTDSVYYSPYERLVVCDIRVGGCGAAGGAGDNTEHGAIEAWNTRHERTCKPNLTERKIDANGETYRFWQAVCECGWVVGEDGVDDLSKFESLDNYCGGCGARVIEE